MIYETECLKCKTIQDTYVFSHNDVDDDGNVAERYLCEEEGCDGKLKRVFAPSIPMYHINCDGFSDNSAVNKPTIRKV